MPPKRTKKTQKKEDTERQKKILSAREKILAKKRLIVKIVEKMIDDDVAKEWFLSNCTYLCQSDFNDVVQERNIESMCGYPLCSNFMEQTLKQKYHISQITNKVYDLTERKCYCSNQCYKASNYVRAQLSPIPLYMRKDEKIKVNLLSDCDNRGSAGEEVLFHHIIPQEEIYKVYSEEASNNLQNLLNEEVKKCADSLSGLQIKEHLYEKQYVFNDETASKSDTSAQNDKRESASDSEVDSDDSTDEKLFPSYDNEPALSNRHMPIPEKIKKSVLIAALKPEIIANSQKQNFSQDFARNVFKDWMTEDTLKYLMGEKYVYGVKADHLFKAMTESEFSSSEKLASVKNEYIQLCLKIDSLPDGDDDIIDSPELDLISESISTPVSQIIVTENNSVKKGFKRRPRKTKDKNKYVAFSPENKTVDIQLQMSPNTQRNEINSGEMAYDKKHLLEECSKLPDKEQHQSETDQTVSSKSNEVDKESTIKKFPEPEPAFPLIDSVSQNVLRRQVLTNKLKSVYSELLPVVGLHYTDIREAVRKFVDSLSLTPTNIIFKPKEWKVISLILFRMLTRTVLKDIHDELQFAKLCVDPLIPVAVDLREIETLVCDLVSTENIINIY